MLQKKIAMLLILAILCLTGCTAAPGSPSESGSSVDVNNNQVTEAVDLKAGDSLVVTVTMADSGVIKSMALSFSFDDSAFEIVDGDWLNQHAIIADFNIENKDAAIAFKEDTNYCGEIFEVELTAKKDITVVDNIITVDPVLKNEQLDVECKGLTLSYEKK